jgi:hypothetical protein
MTAPAVDRAVYFLGNDRVLNFGIAAFESFRRTNPDLPAYLLPFNDDLAKTRLLATRYRIQIIEDPSLKTLHETAEEFWDEKHRDHAMLKKFYAFFGPAKCFLYADCDVLFLENLNPIFDKFERANLQFLSFESTLDYVYKPGAFRDALVADGGTLGFNAGVFLSRNHSTTLAEVQAFFKQHKDIRREFHDTRDQAMLNYFVDHHRWRHANLAKLDPSYCESNNARLRPVRQRPDGAWVLSDKFSPHHGKRFCILHWNGLKLPTVLPNHRLYRRDRNRREIWTERLRLDRENIWKGKAVMTERLKLWVAIQLHRLKRKLRRSS